VSQYQKGKTNLDFTEARDSEWQWHQLGHMQVRTSLHTDNHASTSLLSFLQAGCPSCRPTNSIKALKAHVCKSDHAIIFNQKSMQAGQETSHSCTIAQMDGQVENITGNKSVPKIIINDTINFFLSNSNSILVITNHNSFWVLFDKIASVYFICNILTF